jgi:hypothetical protein
MRTDDHRDSLTPGLGPVEPGSTWQAGTVADGDLDFWLGAWNCTWAGGTGTNSVTRELDGRVVVERFEALGDDAFTGLSVSMPDALTGGWRQTWVDSTGSYWAFVGGLRADGTFVFGTPVRVDADHLYKRMVFHDIGPDGFRWRWENSPDRRTWTEKWAITYRRRSEAAG